MRMKFNEAGLRTLAQQIAAKVADTDRRFRSRWEGKPVGEVRQHVAAAFGAIGITLPDETASEYARAVSQRWPFKWVLK